MTVDIEEISRRLLVLEDEETKNFKHYVRTTEILDRRTQELDNKTQELEGKINDILKDRAYKPHVCPACSGKGEKDINRDVLLKLIEKNSDRFDEIITCYPCNGKGIVWG